MEPCGTPDLMLAGCIFTVPIFMIIDDRECLNQEVSEQNHLIYNLKVYLMT